MYKLAMLGILLCFSCNNLNHHLYLEKELLKKEIEKIESACKKEYPIKEIKVVSYNLVKLLKKEKHEEINGIIELKGVSVFDAADFIQSSTSRNIQIIISNK